MISPNDTSYINSKTPIHTMEWQNRIFRGKLQILHTPQLLLWTTFLRVSCVLAVLKLVRCLGREEQKTYIDLPGVLLKIYLSQVKAATSYSHKLQPQPSCQTQPTLILTLWSALARSTDALLVRVQHPSLGLASWKDPLKALPN